MSNQTLFTTSLRAGCRVGARLLETVGQRRLGAAVVAAAFALGIPASVLAAPPSVDFAGSATWLGQVPIMVAVDKGFFKEQGIDVKYQVILSSSDRMAALTSGSVGFSNLGRSAVVSQMAQGNDTFYIFGNIDTAPGSEGCWARPGYASIKSLRGKPVASNTSAAVTLDGLLSGAGMTMSDIKYIDMPPNEMVAALSKGDVDALCVWQPFLASAQKAVPDGKLVGTDMDLDSYKKYKTPTSSDILIISKKLADEHPDLARKIAIGVFKGVDYTNQHPAETAAAVAHYFRVPAAEVEAGMKTFKYYGIAGSQAWMKMQEAQMGDLAQYLYRTHKISAVPDVRKWVNVSFVPKQ